MDCNLSVGCLYNIKKSLGGQKYPVAWLTLKRVVGMMCFCSSNHPLLFSVYHFLELNKVGKRGASPYYELSERTSIRDHRYLETLECISWLLRAIGASYLIDS